MAEQDDTGHNGEPTREPTTGPDGNGYPSVEPVDGTSDRTTSAVDAEQPPRLPFTVVGIGASAGGLEAMTEFLAACRSDTGMAFVLIQHLPPQRESMMAELLGKQTKMPVQQVEEGMLVKPDHVYVIRPGHVMTIRRGRLHLGEQLERRAVQRPVDDFFRSLAVEQRERAVCVILSGMGSNGTAGAQMIKAVGGIIVAQDPESAKFPSMPRAPIDAGWADYVLTPKEMPEALAKYANHAYAKGTRSAEGIARRDQKFMAEILGVLRSRTRHDFSGYKKPTIVRRVQRRMGLNHVAQVAEYARLLRQTPAEATALADDLLIHVTGFFRDPDAWEALRTRVIVPLVAHREDGAPIRCWVSACSSGEEAYTLGMLLIEEAERSHKHFDIKIFATDMAERSLSHARAGVFPGGIEAEMTAERLARFFDKDESNYRISRELRELVIFAPQNVLQDPPFSRMDVCTCRNLLIYLEPDMQRKVLLLLHFGLIDGGTLFLGTSETLGQAENLFDAVDKKHRIYRRIGPTRHGAVDFPTPHRTTLAYTANPLREGPAGEFRPPRASLAQMTQRALLDRFAPASIVVDRSFNIAYYHGRTELFLDQPRGEPTRDLMNLARESVRGAIRTALQAAIDRQEEGTARDGTVKDAEGTVKRVVVRARPLEGKGTSVHFYLISFDEVPEPAAAAVPAGDAATPDVALQQELNRVREDLQTTIEALQATNEEMKASNEEVTSINEELQSANEELETSKEELQSLNEELTTVNSQLQAKMEELQATTNDLQSLLSSTDLAVIFLDPQFRIRRFTPAVKPLIDLIASDVGRPLKDLARKFTDPDLLDDAVAVLAKLIPIEREIHSDSGRWFVRRITPYRTVDDRINGVVLTFHDVTDRRRAEAARRQSEARYRALTNATSDVVYFMSPDWTEMKRLDGRGFLPDTADPSPSWLDQYIPADEQPKVLAAVAEATRARSVFELEHRVLTADGTVGWTLSRAVPLTDDDGAIEGWFGIASDITGRKRAEEALRQSEELRRMALESGRMGAWHWDCRARQCWADAEFMRLWGLPPSEEKLPLATFTSRMSAEGATLMDAVVSKQIAPGEEFDGQLEIATGPTAGRWVRWRGRAERQTPWVINGVSFDITDQRLAEERVRDSEVRFRTMADVVPELLWQCDASGNAVWHNQRWSEYAGQSVSQARDFGWLEAIHPDDRPETRATFRHCVETGEPWRREHRVRRASDGAYRWFLVQALPLREEDGRIDGWFGSLTDIHEQRLALRTVQESADQIRLAVQATKMGFWEWSVADGVFRGDARDLAVMGLPAGTPGVTVAEFVAMVHADDRDRVAALLRDAPVRRDEFLIEFRIAAPGGGVRWVAKYGHPIFPDDHAARATRVLGTTLDVTEQKQVELDRDARLSAEQVARRAAEAASEAKDQFLASVSHELRTPLSAILLWAKVLRTPAASDSQRAEGLNVIARAAESQRELIEDLLDTSRIVSGKLRLNVRTFDLPSLVRDAVENVRPAADARRIELRLTVDPSLDSVQADPERVRQVLWNLLTNAVKFTPNGGRVDVDARRAGDDVDLTVSDTGQGIPPEALPHVFERFWQAEAAARQTKGLGLGLSIAKQLVELHGGTVDVSSGGTGKGSTFRVRLPLPAQDPKAVRPAPRRQTKPPTDRLRDVRLLLVEDDDATRDALAVVLRTAGATVTPVATVADALAAYRSDPPDLILSDIGLPDGDGHDLIRQIRTDEADRKSIPTPAVALTALARRQDRRRSAESGFQQHLAKPVDPDVLIRTLVGLLDR